MNEPSTKIYFDNDLNQLPIYYNRDLIKVLFINPKNIFVIWGISSITYKKLETDLKTSSENISFELLIHYKSEDKKNFTKKISLPAFSTDWFFEFSEPVKDVKAELIGFTEFSNSISILHSSEISIPSKKPSLSVNMDWIHPHWLEYSQTISKPDETILIPKNEFAQQQQLQTAQGFSLELNPFFENQIFHSDGSSGILSSFSSSGHKK